MLLRRLRCFLVVALAIGAVAVTPARFVPTASAACDKSTLNATQLNAVFANPGIGGGAGYTGGDYQHAYRLPDGRMLWLFQDMFFSASNDVRNTLGAAAHNAGLIEDGTCWSVVGGPGKNYIGQAQTTPLYHWFWPLDGEMGADGTLWVFMAEMRNPNGTGATWGSYPAGTWVARIDPSSLAVLSFAPAPDSGQRLYGWSIVNDGTYSYMYGHCYRQYVHQVNGVGQFDSTCMPNAYLARVPQGHFEYAPEYWTGGAWSLDKNAAKPIMTRGNANPMSVQRFGNVYVNVTKIDDWWGAWIYVDKAPNPWGPWELDQAIWMVDARKCSQCGNYSAFLMPTLDNQGKMTVAYSNGGAFSLWYPNTYLYRPSFLSVTVPTYRTDPPVTGAGLVPQTPVRGIDTRQTNQRVKGGSFLVVPLAGKVPGNAVGVVANVAAVNPGLGGYLTVWPCGAAMPTASVLNFRANTTTANGVHTRLDPLQRLCIYSSADTDVLVDVTAAYTPTGGLGVNAVASTQIADTGATLLAANTTVQIPVTNVAGVPASGAGAVTVGVTASRSTAGGWLTVWPCNASMPLASTLNFAAGATTSNAATVPVDASGAVCVRSSVAAEITVDMEAWWSAGGRKGTLDLHRRVLETRPGTPPAGGSVIVADLSGAVAPGTQAAVVNVTAVGPASAGGATAWPCGAQPGTEITNYAAGETRAGHGVVGVTGDRTVCVSSTATAHLVVDVMVSF